MRPPSFQLRILRCNAVRQWLAYRQSEQAKLVSLSRYSSLNGVFDS